MRLWSLLQQRGTFWGLCFNTVGTVILVFYVGTPYVGEPSYIGLESIWWFRVGAGLNFIGFFLQLIPAAGGSQPPLTASGHEG
jgi:hypothetical protein